jgi:hypothetical protein
VLLKEVLKSLDETDTARKALNSENVIPGRTKWIGKEGDGCAGRSRGALYGDATLEQDAVAPLLSSASPPLPDPSPSGNAPGRHRYNADELLNQFVQLADYLHQAMIQSLGFIMGGKRFLHGKFCAAEQKILLALSQAQADE